MSKKVVVATLCVSIVMMTGCNTYRGNSTATEEASEVASDEAFDKEKDAASGVSTQAADPAMSELSNAASSEVPAQAASNDASLNDKAAGNSSASSSTSLGKAAGNSSAALGSSSPAAKKKGAGKNSETSMIPVVEEGITEIGDRGVEVKFTWEPVEGADKYDVYVEGKQRDSLAYKYIEDVITSDPNYSYSDELNYDIRIKVRVHNDSSKSNVQSEWSEYATGSTNEDSLETPVVKDGILRNGANGKEVYFSWEAVRGADLYEVVVEHKKSGDSNYEYKESTYSKVPSYSYTGRDGYDVRITVKAQKNAWINGKKKVFSSQVSDYAKGKT